MPAIKLDEESSESDVFKELYCVKSVQIRNFFRSLFSRIRENAEKTLDTFYAVWIVIDVLNQKPVLTTDDYSIHRPHCTKHEVFH